MNLSELNAYFGIIGGFAGGGSLYYAWKNDKLARFMPHDKKIDEAFSGNENASGLITSVRTMLQRLRSSRELRIALSVARQMHFARPMDDALIEINRRAIELNNLGFAYHVASKAQFAVALVKMLQSIVSVSLENGDVKFAQKCANRMHFALSADNARKLILAYVHRTKD